MVNPISLRQKIAGCIARGGIADRDAPSCQESTLFWATLPSEETTEDDVTSTLAMSSKVNTAHALGAFDMPLAKVGAAVRVSDPVAMLRDVGEPRQSQQAAPASSAPAQRNLDPLKKIQVSQVQVFSMEFIFCSGSKTKAKAKATAKASGQPKAAPLSDVALAGKTVPEKVALVRLNLKIFFP